MASPEPKKKKALEGAIIAFTGHFLGMNQIGLSALVRENGGIPRASVSPTVTHLVTSELDDEADIVNSNKYKQAIAMGQGIRIVNRFWLTESIELGALQVETPFLVPGYSPAGQLKPSDYPIGGMAKIVGTNVNVAAATKMRAARTTGAATKTGAAANKGGVTNIGGVVDNAGAAKNMGAKQPIGFVDLTDDDEPVVANPTPVGLTGRDNPTKNIAGANKKRSHDNTGFPDNTAHEHASKKLKMKDGQQAKSASLHVPVDEAFPNPGSFRVLIMDSRGPYPAGTIMDALLNQTQVGLNANKFYRIQLLANTTREQYFAWTHWGRVGDAGQSKQLGNGSFEDALKQFESKFKEKSGLKWDQRNETPKSKKYTFIERDYNISSDEAEEDALPGAGSRRGSKQSNTSVESIQCTLQKPVQRLMEMIFNQQFIDQTLAELHYDAQKLPLGKLSKRTLNIGFGVLKNLAELIRDPSTSQGVPYATAIEDLTNQYYTTIPHVFGRNRPPLINSEGMIKREVEMLEALTDMEIAAEIMKDTKVVDENGNAMHQLDRHFAGLGIKEMTPLEPEAKEFKELEMYLTKLTGSTHGLAFKAQDIFRVCRAEEEARFASSKYANLPKNLSDRRLLWHGSRCTNYGGILSQGLRIAPPEAPVSGYMFGKGVYLADISSKSANYCFASNSANIGLLLLCEAELGNPMLELKHANADAGNQALSNGHFTTLGQGGMKPVGWKDAGIVHESLKGVMMPDVGKGQVMLPPGQMDLLYNEYIAYDVAQIRLRYLLRVEMKHGSSY